MCECCPCLRAVTELCHKQPEPRQLPGEPTKKEHMKRPLREAAGHAVVARAAAARWPLLYLLSGTGAAW